MLQLLHLNNYYELYRFYHPLTFPLIGSYGKLTSLKKDSVSGEYSIQGTLHRGGLMKITLENDLLKIKCREDNCLYEIQFRALGMVVCDSHSNVIFTIKCQDDTLLFVDEHNQIRSRYVRLAIENDNEREYPQKILMNNNVNIYSILPPTKKLYNGVYGPHGIETIYLTLDELSSLSTEFIQHLPTSVDWNQQSHAIIGRKITGDDNVPAEQISFIASSQSFVTDLEKTVRGLIDCLFDCWVLC